MFSVPLWAERYRNRRRRGQSRHQRVQLPQSGLNTQFLHWKDFNLSHQLINSKKIASNSFLGKRQPWTPKMNYILQNFIRFWKCTRAEIHQVFLRATSVCFQHPENDWGGQVVKICSILEKKTSFCHLAYCIREVGKVECLQTPKHSMDRPMAQRYVAKTLGCTPSLSLVLSVS